MDQVWKPGDQLQSYNLLYFLENLHSTEFFTCVSIFLIAKKTLLVLLIENSLPNVFMPQFLHLFSRDNNSVK